MVPLDLQKTQQISGATLLTVDRWDTYAGAQLLGTETVDFASLGDRPCPAGSVSRDSLLALLRAGNADRGLSRPPAAPGIRPEQAAGRVLQYRRRGRRLRPLLGALLELARLRTRHLEGGVRGSGDGPPATEVRARHFGLCAPLHRPGDRPGQPGAALRVHPAILVLLPVQRRRQQARGGLGAHQRGHQSDVPGDRPPDRRAGGGAAPARPRPARRRRPPRDPPHRLLLPLQRDAGGLQRAERVRAPRRVACTVQGAGPRSRRRGGDGRHRPVPRLGRQRRDQGQHPPDRVHRRRQQGARPLPVFPRPPQPGRPRHLSLRRGLRGDRSGRRRGASPEGVRSPGVPDRRRPAAGLRGALRLRVARQAPAGLGTGVRPGVRRPGVPPGLGLVRPADSIRVPGVAIAVRGDHQPRRDGERPAVHVDVHGRLGRVEPERRHRGILPLRPAAAAHDHQRLVAGPGAEQPRLPERADRGADHAAADRRALQGAAAPGPPRSSASSRCITPRWPSSRSGPCRWPAAS